MFLCAELADGLSFFIFVGTEYNALAERARIDFKRGVAIAAARGYHPEVSISVTSTMNSSTAAISSASLKPSLSK